MDFVDKIVNDISTLNEFGKYNLIEQLNINKMSTDGFNPRICADCGIIVPPLELFSGYCADCYDELIEEFINEDLNNQ